MNCFLRTLIDNNFSHLIFIPIINKLLNTPNKKKWIIILLLVFWLWPIAYTCSPSGNLFIRSSGSIANHILFIFIVTYVVSRILPLTPLAHFIQFEHDGIVKYTIIAILSYILVSKLGHFTSFLIPITEVFGTLLNPLIWLLPLFKHIANEVMPSIVDDFEK
jgi:hypothetical protein